MRIAAGLMVAALVAGCATPTPTSPAPAASKTTQAPKPAAPTTASTAPKATAAPTSGKALVADAGDKKVCRRQKDIGSNFPQRICKTAAEWAAIDKANLAGVEQFKRDSSQSTGTSPQ